MAQCADAPRRLARGLPQRGAAVLPAAHARPVVQLGGHELPSGARTGALRHVPDHAGLRAGQRRRRDYVARIPQYFPLFARNRINRHGRLLRSCPRQAAGHLPCQLGSREDGSCGAARGGDVAHAAGRGLPGRYRVHDVAVRRFAGLHRPRSGRPRQDRDPDGFAGRRRRGVPADPDLFGKNRRTRQGGR